MPATLVNKPLGFYQSGADAAIRIVGIVVVQIAARIHVPHVVGVLGARRFSSIPKNCISCGQRLPMLLKVPLHQISIQQHGSIS